MKQVGIYRVSYELMAKFLKLDDEHMVVDILADRYERTIEVIGVKVVGPKMPEKIEGSEGTWVPLDHLEHMKEAR